MTSPISTQFEDEVAAVNSRSLRWATLIFAPIYAAWTVFDYALAPAQYGTFLLFRLAACALNLAVLALVWRRPAASIRAYWIWFYVWGALVAPMLPWVGPSFLAYTIGFCIVIFGAGAIPLWPPRMAASVVAAIVVTALIAIVGHPPAVAVRDFIAAGFAVVSVTAVAVVTSWLKFTLTRQEFEARSALAREQAETTRLRDAEQAKAQELEVALGKLQVLDQARTRFFANVSHELRTPLTLILSPVQELLGRPGLAEIQPDLVGIARNAGRLLRLIDDLLEMSRLDAGGLRLTLADLDMSALCGTLLETARSAAQAQGVELVLVAPTSAIVVGDAHRLEIVLTNLIGNALKYAPGGGLIRVEVDDATDRIDVTVRDNGPGIPAEDLAHVFERFYQVNRRDRRQQGGVGIGLALAKELAELHGGELTAGNNPAGGAFFTLTLRKGRDHFRPEVIERRSGFRPQAEGRRGEDAGAGVVTAGEVAAAAAGAERADRRSGRRVRDTDAPVTVLGGAIAGFPSGESQPIPRLVAGELSMPGGARPRILIVEDRDELRVFLKQLLVPSAEVIEATDGDDGFARMLADRPDLVLSDVMMPGTSGTELCRRIKADPQLASTPVILLTARVGSEATLEAYAHGADDFVAKPFHPRVLLARIRAQLRLRQLALELASKEKLAAVGLLGAGVAHEVRNPLNAVVNGTTALRRFVGDDARGKQLIDAVVDAGQRIVAIVAALDAHTRPAEGQDRVFQPLHEAVESTLTLLADRVREVTVHRSWGADDAALIQVGKIGQILVNLVDNAVRSGARTLWLSTARVGSGGADGPGPGVRVAVTIADDGPGIPDDLRERVFDAFYTTRPAGEGRGLGLYLSRQMAEDHGGTLVARPRAGGGTTFVLTLPVEPAVAQDPVR
ncbi:MAG: response regulator [Kofleriaceae bacterium]|nr:response regulator [Kofleriaceae bacterium]MBP6840058.1 response regulator [Kofleriaceae bacterium]